MRWLFAHESDEVPVLDSRGAVREHVANKLGVDFGCCVETNCCLEIVVMDISIDCRWNRNNSRWGIVDLKVLCQVKSVGHSSSSANNHETR